MANDVGKGSQSDSPTQLRGHYWNLPNVISLLRLPLAVLVWPLAHSPIWVLGIMCVSGATDVLDGWLARRLKTVGSAGAWLDPLCDKLFVVSTLTMLWVVYSVPLALLLVLAIRELIQGPLAIAYRLIPQLHHRFRYDFRAALVGKLTTVVQFLAVGMLLLGLQAAELMVLAAGALGFTAAVYYLARARKRDATGT